MANPTPHKAMSGPGHPLNPMMRSCLGHGELHIGDYTHWRGQQFLLWIWSHKTLEITETLTGKQHLLVSWSHYTLGITQTGWANNCCFEHGVIAHSGRGIHSCLGHVVITCWGLHTIEGSTILALDLSHIWDYTLA